MERFFSISSHPYRHIILVNRLRFALTEGRIQASLSWPEICKKGNKTPVKLSIEIIKPYKIELLLKLNLVPREMFYRHFATG